MSARSTFWRDEGRRPSVITSGCSTRTRVSVPAPAWRSATRRSWNAQASAKSRRPRSTRRPSRTLAETAAVAQAALARGGAVEELEEVAAEDHHREEPRAQHQ